MSTARKPWLQILVTSVVSGICLTILFSVALPAIIASPTGAAVPENCRGQHIAWPQAVEAGWGEVETRETFASSACTITRYYGSCRQHKTVAVLDHMTLGWPLPILESLSHREVGVSGISVLQSPRELTLGRRKLLTVTSHGMDKYRCIPLFPIINSMLLVCSGWILLACIASLLFRSIRAKWRYMRGHCCRCGYPSAGSICSECGTPVGRKLSRQVASKSA